MLSVPAAAACAQVDDQDVRGELALRPTPSLASTRSQITAYAGIGPSMTVKEPSSLVDSITPSTHSTSSTSTCTMKSKHLSLTINNALDSSSEPATSTSTIKTSTANPMLSIPANAVAASAQVIQVAGRAFKDVGITASHNPLSTSVSTSGIDDLAPVSIPAADVNSADELQVSTSVSACRSPSRRKFTLS
ncbi:hypothetical protein BYT27DRAFT_7341178 [Phlegmacium glaucopus]|nr:hypothetical protein BYT27DRAFT_7341178 [Phlegmacium glaucopus]